MCSGEHLGKVQLWSAACAYLSLTRHFSGSSNLMLDENGMI